MKNKPLKHRDCLRMRGKGTIPSTPQPPRGTGPKHGLLQKQCWKGLWWPNLSTRVPLSPHAMVALGAWDGFAAGTT